MDPAGDCFNKSVLISLSGPGRSFAAVLSRFARGIGVEGLGFRAPQSLKAVEFEILKRAPKHSEIQA